MELRQSAAVLSVSVIGNGSVSATTPPTPLTGGISVCTASGVTCAATYANVEGNALTVVTLTSSPAAGVFR